MLKNLKRKMDERNARVLATYPVHERDQILEATKTWRGTFRYLIRNWPWR